MTAVQAKHFAKPPYHVEQFGPYGWAGVFNRDGINCLTFTDRPGAVVTTKENAELICQEWNKHQEL